MIFYESFFSSFFFFKKHFEKTLTFGILYILCTQKGVLRLILGDRLILMYRSCYSSVDLIEFHGQSKFFSVIIFIVFSRIIRPLRAKTKSEKTDDATT